MRDLDVDVCLLERFGRVLLPDHVAVDGGFIEAHPALEGVVVIRHGEGLVTSSREYFTAVDFWTTVEMSCLELHVFFQQ